MFRPCAVIPVYNHAEPLRGVLEKLRALGLPCILVDDGSGEECRRALEAMAAREEGGVRLLRRARNGGKGAAVKAGLEAAADEGYTHALQVDADGQHDLDAAPALLAAAQSDPEAAICARPEYDAGIPRSRRLGRRLTNFWVAVNTLSRSIPDAMCGFRVYPLAATLKVLGGARLGNRMDFDPEILVRLKWAGCPLRFFPVQVRYPEGGVSHFKMGRDNLLISRMHARLFFGMLALLVTRTLPWRGRA